MTVALDEWLPSASVRTRHRHSAAASPDALWEAAASIRLSDTRHLGRLVRWRIPGLSPSLSYHDLFRTYPFCVLEETEHRLVSGLCGRIWTLSRDYPELTSPEEFVEWSEPGTVRVAFAHWVTSDGDGRSELCTEARVSPVDTGASLRLKATWAVVGPFERLVGSEPLALAAARAES